MIYVETVIILLQALMGGCIVYWLRNDEVENFGGLRWTRVLWVSTAMILAGLLLWLRLFPAQSPAIAFGTWAACVGLIGYILTAPHGQTLRGPHQDIPPEEDDPAFTVAMYITDHQGGAGDKLGWRTWIAYNGIRYALPCALMGFILGDGVVALTGVAIVLGYWPVAHLLYRRLDTQPQFIGAALCGAILYGAL